MSSRAVYSLFGSKAGLIGALAARGFHRLADLVNGLPVTDHPLADLAAAGPHGFRRFALERPHLFRITFDQISEDIYTQPETYPALFASFHSLDCCGLAANELSSKPPPVGANFWKIAKDVDFAALWENALAAFVRGLGPAPRQ